MEKVDGLAQCDRRPGAGGSAGRSVTAGPGFSPHRQVVVELTERDTTLAWVKRQCQREDAMGLRPAYVDEPLGPD